MAAARFGWAMAMLGLLAWGGAGCTRPCKEGTVLLEIRHDPATALAEELEITVTIDGPRTATVRRPAGGAIDTIAIDFQTAPYSTYRGRRVTVEVVALRQGAAIGGGGNQATLAEGCTRLEVRLAGGAMVDLGMGRDLPDEGLDLAGREAGADLGDLARPGESGDLVDLARPDSGVDLGDLAGRDGSGDAGDLATVDAPLGTPDLPGPDLPGPDLPGPDLPGLDFAKPLDGPPTCTDTLRNGNETDVDCGGGCGKCDLGRACKVAGDCQSDSCTGGKCGGWQSIGPWAGSVKALVYDGWSKPPLLYAGIAANAVFKSADGGQRWSRIADGLPSVDMTFADLAIDPKAPLTLYGAARGDGLYKTTDGGRSWADVTNNLPIDRLAFYRLAIDPATPTTVYVGYEETAGVYKTTDGGKSWSPAKTGLAANEVRALAIDPNNPATIFAGTNEGVFKSTNRGLSWGPASNGLAELNVQGLAIDPRRLPAPTLYAATGGNKGGVYKSTDGGTTWAKTAFPQPGGATVAIDPINPDILFAGTSNGFGVYRSDNGGGRWNRVNAGLPNDASIPVLLIHPTRPATVWTGSYDGVFRSDDSGGQWQASNDGLTGYTINALLVDPVSPEIVWASPNFRGVYRSVDGGAKWEAMSSGLSDLGIDALVLAANDHTKICAGSAFGRVFCSENGAPWTEAKGLPMGIAVWALATDPNAPALLYAGSDTAGIFRLENGVWSAVSTGLPQVNQRYPGIRSFFVDSSVKPSVLYAATYAGVYYTTNEGKQWLLYGTGLQNLDVEGVVVAGGKLHCANGAGVFTAAGPQAPWQSSLPIDEPSAIAVSPSEPMSLYLSTYHRGVHRTRNGGGLWSDVSFGNLYPALKRVAIHPKNPEIVYLGSYGGSVYKTITGGL